MSGYDLLFGRRSRGYGPRRAARPLAAVEDLDREPIVLCDAPDDGYCEDFAWVEYCRKTADPEQIINWIPEQWWEAEYTRPQVCYRTEWLQTANQLIPFEEQRWEVCSHRLAAAREFWRIEFVEYN